MAVRKIITYGHPTLRRRAPDVAEVTGETGILIDDLFETMYASNGIGLAAPQIDVLERVIVVDPTPVTEENTRALALINPEVIAYRGATVYEEGCLSVPGTYADVRRPDWVQVRYRNRAGEPVTEEFAGMMSRVIQHEIDHLDGTLFVDRLSPMRRTLVLRGYRRREEAAHGSERPVL